MEKLDGKSMNLKENNIDKIKEYFPEVFEEGKIDFDKLRLLLGDNIEEADEKYEFKWHGKNNAIKISQTPSMSTLRPHKCSSKNWDSTENLYIEGDNLEVLKLIQKSYFGKIKMIYIDPPYNTGKDFVYKDNYRNSIKNYKEITNQITKSNSDTSGRYHTDWLNMMYPRLKLARNLLSEDGVICISLDDNEIHNLRKICDEIFGEENFIGSIVRRRRKSQANLSKNISVVHEYVLIYSKFKGEVLKGISDDIDTKAYKNPDNDPRGVYVTMPCTNKGGAKYSVKTPSGNIIEEEWRFKKETYDKLLSEDKIVFPRGGEGKPRYKLFLSEKLEQGVIVNSWWDNVSSNQEATAEIKKIFEDKIVFDTPKPVDFIKKLIQISTEKDSTVLDFFSGSSTTADAVMQLNKLDNGNRKFIMIQLPERTDEKSAAYKSGYKDICEIGKDRIRKAGEKLLSETRNTNLDVGFKVFKLDDSNIKEWNPSYDELAMTLEDMTDNLKSGRTKEDLLFEILIKMGIELTAPIDEISVGGKRIYNIGMGSLLICLEDEITDDLIKEIPKYKSDFMDMKVVFKETGFKNDSQKMNTMQNLKQFGITDVRSV